MCHLHVNFHPQDAVVTIASTIFCEFARSVMVLIRIFPMGKNLKKLKHQFVQDGQAYQESLQTEEPLLTR